MFIWGIIPVISPVVFTIIGTEEQPEQIAFLFKINNFDKRTSSDEHIVIIVTHIFTPLFQISGEIFSRLPVVNIVLIDHAAGEIVLTFPGLVPDFDRAADRAVAALFTFCVQAATPPLDTSAIQLVRRRLILLLGT